MSLGTLMCESLIGVTLAMLAMWALSLRLRDASIVDIFWGAGFAAIACYSLASGDGFAGRRLMANGLAMLWGLRLAAHLYARNVGHGEDRRYQAMRRKRGDAFTLWSLYGVFGLQGALMWAISLPLQVAATSPTPAFYTLFDALGLLLVAFGLTFEALGDWQLTQFKRDPANAGATMDQGLWAWTRHPNYFGDACVWFGLGAFAFSTGAWWAMLSPALMYSLLTRVSGVPLLERGMKKTRPGYAEYAARTSAFWPRPPRH